MNRRIFLASSATAAASASLPAFAHAAAGQSPLPDTAEGTQRAFNEGLARDRRLLGWRSAAGDMPVRDVRIEGRWPQDLRGVFYRNGPAQHDMNGERLSHWFDGDGFLQRWQVGPAGARFSGRYIATPKRRAEQAAGRFLFPAGGGGIEPRAPMSGPDTVNAANTSILPLDDGRLWALWEGGSASDIDPDSLDWKSFVVLGERLGGVPFSAHPRRGEDGRIWNIGSLGARLALYRLSGTGALEAVKLHSIPPIGLIHDFLLTERSIVVPLPSTRISPDGDGFFAQVRGMPGEPIRVLVFDRETLDKTGEAELPAGSLFHFGNAWEEADGTIRFDMVHSPDVDHLQKLRGPMHGSLVDLGTGRSLAVTLRRSGAPELSLVAGKVEFPKVSPQVACRRNRYVYMPQAHGRSGWYNTLAKADLDTGRISRATFERDMMVEEFVFVPRDGAQTEDDGWLIGTALDWQREQTMLTVFDARRLPDGPLARIRLDVALPLGFHGQFVRG
jgi:all-trans-8'-apo-beta-carotenal 15,15'-oxygenase